MNKGELIENTLSLYHGSGRIVDDPQYGKGNPRNDYGLGFYCTENFELAKEWACNDRSGGYANIYSLDTSTLNVLYLADEPYNILNWLAILINNRTLSISNPIAAESRNYLITWFLPDITDYDAIDGYRADDSYFAFASDFLNNTISISQLKRAMALGSLGRQFVLKSQKTFNRIIFRGSEFIDGEVYYIKRRKRDADAREAYLYQERHKAKSYEDIFMVDILRQEIRQNDVRL